LEEIFVNYQNLKSLLDTQLQEIYSAELHLAKELTTLFNAAVSTEFKSQLMRHSQETERHVEVLGDLLEKRNLGMHETRCKVMDSLLKRAAEVSQCRGDDRLLDLALIFIMRKIESFEQGSYEDAKTIAEALGETDVVKVLELHIREEGQQERGWTVLSEDMVDSLVASSETRRVSRIEERSKGVE
jgi:ferritin-like metal-binding protein YciE